MSPSRPPAPVDIVWQLTGGWTDADIAAAVGALSADERTRCERFRFRSDRRDYAAAHALLRATLSRHETAPPEGWRLAIVGEGKPVLADPARRAQLSFSLTHTDGLVACVVARGHDVGIDAERADRDVEPMPLARRFFAPRETERLAREDDPVRRRARFIELWTVKEAYTKALGGRMVDTLGRAVFDIGPGGRVSLIASPDDDGAAWEFKLLRPSDEYRVAVAIRRTGRQ